ncbi:hypothetical protein EV44_g3793 [Erysiphe necator]|uniref:Uncharacterized protein n=1 Tax=Uncinula necator TaxID=52586 RepID=A0A0B1P6K9_UNCNE|nr:hypothetical protein EV44_g3793 [Erysiphe necator]
MVFKRALPSEPPDAGNRVSKPKPTLGRISRSTAAESHLLLATGNAFGKSVTNEKMHSEEYRSSDLNYYSDNNMESFTEEKASKTPENGLPKEGFSELFGIPQTRNDARTPRATQNSSDESQLGAASLMETCTHPHLIFQRHLD